MRNCPPSFIAANSSHGVLLESIRSAFVDLYQIGERLLIQETNVAREEAEDHAHDEVRDFLFADRTALLLRIPRPHVIGEDTKQFCRFLGEFRLELAGIQTFRVFKQRPKNLERRESRIAHRPVQRADRQLVNSCTRA